MREEAKERHRLGIKYRITEKAKQQHRLGILLFNTTDGISFRNDQPKEEEQLKAFFILLTSATRHYMNVGHELLRMYYKHSLPGFIIPEILDESYRLVLPDDIFSRSEIQESIYLLADEGIIKRIALQDGENRYDLADPLLNLFFKSLWKIWSNLLENVLTKWDYVKSLDQERRWFKQIFGKRKVDAIERFHYSRRISFKKSVRTAQQYESIEKNINYADANFRILLDQNARSIKKYRCLLEPFLEFLYPTILLKRYRSRNLITNRSELHAYILRAFSPKVSNKGVQALIADD
jgi:hypothetical protein